jgi:aminopeptidase N
MNKIILASLCALFLIKNVNAQQSLFNLDDTLRGSRTPERTWWDLTFYDLKVAVNPTKKSIEGSNTIHYKVLKSQSVIQIDLQPPLKINKIVQNNEELSFQKKGKNAYFVEMKTPQYEGKNYEMTVFYEGKPQVAANAPWDGGFSWSKDAKGNPFIATSCQGLGASIWWPCKDHMYDEPDSMSIAATVPKNLMDVSNGRLRKTTENADGTHTFEWFVKNPINNYGVNVNIAEYTHFSEKFQGEKGELSLDYYILPENLEKAKKQFKQVPMMLKAFEHWFGPYPFYEDGYKLVEVPYLGMEHQSSVTYGNKYGNGYLGRDLSGTGWGLKWDFIIIHESGHEWFANNITYNDMADMWIHESFTNYSESLFTEFHFGKKAGSEYMIGSRSGIRNQAPVIGIYNVNNEGSGDMYPKGGNMLHNMRQIVDNDEKWRGILRGLNKTFYHKTVDAADIENYMIKESGKDLQPIFNQYLRHIEIPILECKISKNKIEYRWTNCIDNFNMPLKVSLEKGKLGFIYPTKEWKTSKTKIKSKGDFKVDENFYVNLKWVD